MKNFKTFGGCSTALLAAFILTPPAFAQDEDEATNTPGIVTTPTAPTTGTTTGEFTDDGIIAIGGRVTPASGSGDDRVPETDTRATVEQYYVTSGTPGMPGAATHMLDRDGTGTMHMPEAVTIRGDQIFVPGVGGALIGTLETIDGAPSFSLSKNTAEDSAAATTHTAVSTNAIAIGADSVVRGDDSVAIGPGATVVRVETMSDPDTPTHMLDRDGVGTMHAPEAVTIRGDQIFVPGVGGALIGTLETIDGAPSFSLSKNTAQGTDTTTRINVDRATAIGANSEVQADGGVAIGAGAEVTGEGGIAIGGGTAGVDANGNGDYTDAGDTAPTIVTAAANEITIGGATHTGDIKIGNVVLQENGVNHIAANRDNINNNRNSIATNKNDIETNTKGIASAIAIAGLATGPGSGLSIGFGSFQSETSIAIGYDNTFGAEQNMTFKAAAASAGSGSTAGSVSMRWAF